MVVKEGNLLMLFPLRLYSPQRLLDCKTVPLPRVFLRSPPSSHFLVLILLFLLSSVQFWFSLTLYTKCIKINGTYTANESRYLHVSKIATIQRTVLTEKILYILSYENLSIFSAAFFLYKIEFLSTSFPQKLQDPIYQPRHCSAFSFL